MNEIDHIEISGPPRQSGVDSCNFVLCPGKSLRSFSLRHRDKRQAGLSLFGRAIATRRSVEAGRHSWKRFRRRIEIVKEQLFPLITGTAYVTADSQLILQDGDPFRWGIRP